ncbi:transcriptional regulator, ArgR family [Clostridium collagenovorans DSM 3089]|uniref:Arginine repressor n=1 Tax=Clostridium collagenovorans DSM 3089 TaxID=1121306 RepID=A0A1M5T509_9CLOT|nr:arginine repressor [Clostridium collagenovorans]SHH45814.1 transcriptional regulator, ArgR family [Clostridium collagenovorans DSM 3089]
MKSKRQSLILEIVNSMDIETQEELVIELKKVGIHVKQSTLSRDIKDLRLTKVLGDNGVYKYASIHPTSDIKSERFLSILRNTVLNVEKVDKFVIIKTISGSASAAAEALDCLAMQDIAGTIAGDNTIFMLIRSEERAEKLMEEILKIINSKE